MAGWFAKDPTILRRVGHVLLQVPYTVPQSPRSIVVADDCFNLLNSSADRVSQAVVKSVEKLFGSKFELFYLLYYDPLITVCLVSEMLLLQDKC